MLRFAIPFLALLSPLAQAQTTHDVSLFGFEFAPKNITIEVGDTVRWTWISGFHNVQSGQGGIANGIFDSVVFTLPPFVYEVTFDQAFVDANPVPGGVYDYYCAIHLPNMTGTVTVKTTPVGQLDVYGPANLFGSLFVGGFPNTGGDIQLTLQNPLVAPAGPGFGAVFISTSPDPNFPNGTPIPTFGLVPGTAGELLISSFPPNPVLTLGPVPWATNSTVTLQTPIPNSASLAGQKLYAQGALIDPTKTEPVGLTQAVEITIG
jgi:plastocyanin